MKILIASDLHGSARYCRALLEAVRREEADRVVLLGDLLYHGPRNPLPEEYDTQATAAMLGELTGRVLCVRGNCDSEVDQMVLPFPILADCAWLAAEGAECYLTHGHLHGPDDPPPLAPGECLVEQSINTPELFEVGNQLVLASPDADTPLSDTLVTDTFTIVGVAESPLYLTYDRGSSTVGNGSVACFLLVPESAFCLEVATDVYLRAQAAEGLDLRVSFVSQYYYDEARRQPHVLVMNYSGLEAGKVEQAVDRLCRAVLGPAPEGEATEATGGDAS